MGIIEQLIPGNDGVVRAAKVRTTKSLLERAVKRPTQDVAKQETLNAKAQQFRLRRDAAVAVEIRVHQQHKDEEI